MNSWFRPKRGPAKLERSSTKDRYGRHWVISEPRGSLEQMYAETVSLRDPFRDPQASIQLMNPKTMSTEPGPIMYRSLRLG